MPIYEYRCEACGHELEELQKLADAPLTECPACGKPALARLVSAAGFQLKGSGWYQTDFKGKSKGESRKEDKGGDGTACTPSGCEKPGCAAKPDAA
jgi:putative FmdB family regulatory protein